ncbi:MAG: sulfate transporter CysZ [Desulfuromonas sp.]|nr:MAG: sulfate transporter CysZ [Desulfuromonas sp.]
MHDLLRDNPISNFSRGFLYPFRGGRFLLRSPRLWKYVVVPFLINLVIFSLSVWFGLDFFNDKIVAMIPSGEAWYWVILYYLLWVVAIALTAVLVFFTFTVVGLLIASPFNDLLSERTEEVKLGTAEGIPFSFAATGKILFEEAKKMAVFVVGMLLLLLLNLIPGIGTLIYSVLSFLFTVFFLAVEYSGFVFSRKGEGFRQQRRYLLQRKFLNFGFGVGVLCLLAIPFLQFFCIPLGVIGATLLWCDTRETGHQTVGGEG